MLLQLTNTSPKQLMFAGMNSVGAMSFADSDEIPDSPAVVNGHMSAIIFGDDGQTLYNYGQTNEAPGIYRMSLPFTGSTPEKMIVNGCSPKPWTMASDMQGNIYGSCGSNVAAWNSAGKQLWSANFMPDWVVLSEDEMVTIAGTASSWHAFNSSNGKVLWSLNTAGVTISGETGVTCYESGQPWAPRFPIPLPSAKLALLCKNSEGFNFRFIDINSGTVDTHILPLNTNTKPAMVTADTNSLYAYVFMNSTLSVIKVPYTSTK